MKDGSPLITYRPLGRLGNQMFQAAACIGYSKKHNVKWGAPRQTREVPEFHQWFPGLPICETTFRTYQEHPGAHCPQHGVHKDLCHFDYHPIPFHPTGVQLLGFFQSYKYFENAEAEVRRAFNLKYVEGYEDYVSIHVRRGDYVQHAGSFPPVTVDYLTKACWALPSASSRKVIMFSDDIQWCKENFEYIIDGKSVIEYSEGRNTYEDLCLMASCGHHIIANSTFSWWAAYLGKNPERIVISPSHKKGNWFGHSSGIKKDCVDLLPKTWKQIEFR